MMKMYRGITIGAGHFSYIQLDAWKHVKGAEIIGVASRRMESARKLAETYNVQHYGQEIVPMIERLKPDFIDICTPPDSHFHYAKIAADYGIPVLCQKPVAPSQQESEALVRYCKERNVPIMINENWRWQRWYREVKNIIDSGRLGRLFHVYFAMRPGDGWGDEPYPLQPYFKNMEKFLLFETGVHWIDTFRYLFGEIERVYCQARTWNPVCKGEDAVVVCFDFENGMTGIYDANRVVYMEETRPPTYGWMTLEGEMGKLRIELDGRIYLTLRDGKEFEHTYDIPEGWMGGCAVATQQHFIDGLNGRVAFETEGEAYLVSQQIVYACYESMEKKMPVEIKSCRD